jgi:heat-inducible transcriptional repressor
MDELTQRQIDILKTIIKQYTEAGEPVGSEILEKKYKLGVSPATIRNEMVVLAKKGYLRKAHFSSGRIPSAKGFRFYIRHLMKEKELSTADEVAYKNSVWDERKETHRLLSQATKVLAHRTGLLSLVATNFGDLYYSGIANLMDKQEFLNWQLSKLLFERLDEVKFWERILIQAQRIEEDMLYLLGSDDFSDPVFETCASVFGEFETDKVKGIIGVVGPKRMSYEAIVPQIKYFSSLLEQIIKDEQVKS